MNTTQQDYDEFINKSKENNIDINTVNKQYIFESGQKSADCSSFFILGALFMLLISSLLSGLVYTIGH